MAITTPLLRAAVAATVLAAAGPRLEAGPPAICHQFQTAGAPSLPWADGPGWRRPVPGYDLSRLVDETLGLLTPATPVLARMETLRRATIYASTDARVASELLSRVLGRALDGVGGGVDRLALFDAGYLVESYRQANIIYRHDMLRGEEKRAWVLRDAPKGLNGYSWIVSALEMGPADPEMEFAASRVSEGAASQAHVRKALAGARAGTALSATLADFGYTAASLVRMQ